MALHFGAVTQRINVVRTGTQGLVGEDAAIGVQAGFLGHADTRAQANGREHHVGFQFAAVGQLGDQLTVVAVVYRLGQRAKMELHPQIRQATAHGFGGLLRQQQRQAAPHGLDQGYLETTVGQVIGEFTADQAATEDGHGFLAVHRRAEFAVVHQIIDGEHLTHRVAFQRRGPGVGAQCQYQLAVVQVVIGQQHALVGGINAGHMHAGAHVYIELLGHFFRGGHAQVIGGFFLGETGRQHGLGVVAAVVSGEHDDRRFLVQLAEFLDGVEAGQAGTDDDNRVHEQSLTINGRAM